MLPLLLSALSLGFLSSFHCVGMCGPLALALPLDRSSKSKILSGIFIYHFGKATTYGLLGILIAFMGAYFPIHISQQRLTVISGVFFILIAIYPWLNSKNSWIQKSVLKILNPFQKELANQLKKRRKSALLGIGFLNGFLPCSMVYLALAVVLQLNTWWLSFGFMYVFALGTLPAMVSFQYFGLQMSGAWRYRIQKILPYLLIITGILLILRGMNLDIPYISPSNGTLNTLTPEACD